MMRIVIDSAVCRLDEIESILRQKDVASDQYGAITAFCGHGRFGDEALQEFKPVRSVADDADADAACRNRGQFAFDGDVAVAVNAVQRTAEGEESVEIQCAVNDLKPEEAFVVGSHVITPADGQIAPGNKDL